MKLAELLTERKAIKEEIKKIKERLDLSATVQEGDAMPPEDPEELKSIFVGLYVRLADLIVKINRTNGNTRVGEKSLMEWIADRDKNLAIANGLHRLAEEATPKPERFSRNEIRYVPMINIKEVRQEADRYAKRAREIDVMIQTTNWNTELSGG
ncbi:MAG: DIP1984 family protein [Nitrospiria bacterium]